MKKENDVVRKEIVIFMSMVLFCVSNLWSILRDTGFTLKDYEKFATVNSAQYTDFFTWDSDGITVSFFLKALYGMLGLNSQVYFVILLAIHLFNSILIYILLKKFVIMKFQTGDMVAYIIAMVFACIPFKNIAAAQLSGLPFLLGSSFLLLMIYFFEKYVTMQEYKEFYALMIIVFACFSLDCSICNLPIVILIEIYFFATNKQRKICITIGIIMLFFIGKNFFAFELINCNSIMDTFRYHFMLFDFNNSELIYRGKNVSSIICIILNVIVLYISFVTFYFKKNKTLIYVYCIEWCMTFIAAIAYQKIERNFLYLHATIICFLLAYILQNIFDKIKSIYLLDVICFIFLGVWLLNYCEGSVETRNKIVQERMKQQYVVKGIEAIKELPFECNVYMKNCETEIDNIIEAVQNNYTIKTFYVNDFPKDAEQPYVFLEYDEGYVREVKRNELPPEVIIQTIIYSRENFNGTTNGRYRCCLRRNHS